MPVISIPRPWAGAALMRVVEVINVPRPIRVMGRWFIHANRMIDPYGPETGLDRLHSVVIGSVKVTACERAEDVQLHRAFGPWCLQLDQEIQMLTKPYPIPHMKPFEIVSTRDIDFGELMSLEQWHANRRDEAALRSLRDSPDPV